MAKKKFNGPRFEGGNLVVVNKKIKKSDILAAAVCLLAAFVMWIYATNAEIEKEKELEDRLEGIQASQDANS